jgi:GAF domain-containing protein
MTRVADFRTSYAAALAAYVADRAERRLKSAYDLGRAAVEQGLGVLDVADAHNEAIARAAGGANDVLAVLDAGGEFLIESLAAFEVVQRGATEAWRSAWAERRRARMVRELSGVLADAAIASAAAESADELAQLLAEMLREMLGAAESIVAFETRSSKGPVRAVAVEPEADTWSEIVQPAAPAQPHGEGKRSTIVTPIVSIDGTECGRITTLAPPGASFTEDDRAVLRQVADLTAAWLERTREAPYS